MNNFELNLKSNRCTLKKLKKHLKKIIKADFMPVFQINAYPQHIIEYISQNNILIYKNKTFIPLNEIIIKLNKYIKKIYDKTKKHIKIDGNLKKAIKLSKKSLGNEIIKEKKILQSIFQKNENNLKKCPYCSTPIIKSGGCSHIKCAACNKHFYWENALSY